MSKKQYGMWVSITADNLDQAEEMCAEMASAAEDHYDRERGAQASAGGIKETDEETILEKHRTFREKAANFLATPDAFSQIAMLDALAVLDEVDPHPAENTPKSQFAG